jgi:hypothetical protein
MNIYNHVPVIDYVYPSSIDIIISSDGSCGVLLNSVNLNAEIVYMEKGPEEGTTKIRYLDEETLYPEIAFAYFYFIDDIPDDAVYSYSNAFLMPNEVPLIAIYSQKCLVDPKTPLRYSLAAAFDNNPATSYVENTKDDLFSITFAFYCNDKDKPLVTKAAIINGYAASRSLYFQNSRPSEVEIDDSKQGRKSRFMLRDSVLRPQILVLEENTRGDFVLTVTGVYRGSAYNDTCIAEINLEFDSRVWIFGNIND